MMGSVTRIPVPDWAKDHARGVVRRADGFGDADFRTVQAHREPILALVHRTVESYLLGPMTFEDGFPSRGRLTGEYYIGSEYYTSAHDTYLDPASGAVVELLYRVAVRARCLQRPRPHHRPDAYDYLGLSVDVRCDPDRGWLSVFGCDSQVI